MTSTALERFTPTSANHTLTVLGTHFLAHTISVSPNIAVSGHPGIGTRHDLVRGDPAALAPAIADGSRVAIRLTRESPLGARPSSIACHPSAVRQPLASIPGGPQLPSADVRAACGRRDDVNVVRSAPDERCRAHRPSRSARRPNTMTRPHAPQHGQQHRQHSRAVDPGLGPLGARLWAQADVDGGRRRCPAQFRACGAPCAAQGTSGPVLES